MALPAIILAAGASSRLGHAKQLVRVGNETLIHRTIRMAKEVECDPIFVVLGARREEITKEAALSNVDVLFNKDWVTGIASSIRVGLSAVAHRFPEAQATMLLVCDQPTLTSAHLRELIHRYDDSKHSIIASYYVGGAGIPAIFPSSQFHRLLQLEGDTGARHLLRNPESAIIMVAFEGGEVDVDTPQDLTKLY